MPKTNFLGKKFLTTLICLFCGILCIFWIVASRSHLDKNLHTVNADVLDAIDQRMVSLFYEINNFPRNAANDILFLNKLSSLTKLLDITGASAFRNQQAKVLQGDLLEFIRENSAYYKLEYIDETGQEITGVFFDGTEYGIISDQNLQDLFTRSYFGQTTSLDVDEVLISPLELNIKNGVLENRGNVGNPIYVPVIRYTTPLFDSALNRKGILTSSVYADYFLDRIRRFQREGEKVFLIDDAGYYLAHPQRSKEFGFILNKDDNFYQDYPDVSPDILEDFSQRQTETSDYLFSFRHIYPTLGSFELYKGSEKILGKNSAADYYWTLVAVSDKSDMQRVSADLKQNFWISLLLFGLINAVIIFLVLRLYRL